MSVPPTPFPTPGQPPNWGQQLIDAIVDRLGLTNDEVDALRVLVDAGRLSPAALAAAFADKGAVDALQDLTSTGRLSEASLMSTFAHLDDDQLTTVSIGPHIIAYDSGWRTIVEWDATGTPTYGSLLANMVPMPNEPGFLRLRRRDDKVTLAMKGFEATGVVVYNPPFNFRRIDWSPLYLQTGSGKTVNYSDAIYLPSGEYPRMETIEWETLRSIPTSLPGIPA